MEKKAILSFSTTELQDQNSEHQKLSIEYESAQSNVQKQLMDKVSDWINHVSVTIFQD